MKERLNQNEFPETACPIGPISEFEQDSRSFYFAPLFKRPYQGRFRPKSGEWSWGAASFTKPAEGVLEFSGKRYCSILGPAVVWHQAEDDVNYPSQKLGNEPLVSPRHFHADFEFRKRRVHVDFLKFVRWGPLSGVYELSVFSDGQFITRGGYYSMPPVSGRFNWPLTAPIRNSLVTLEGSLELTDKTLAVARIEFWVPAR